MTPICRILLIEDDEDDYLLTRDMLHEAHGAPFKLHWEKSFNAGLKALETADWDVVLVDFALGPQSGLDLVREITRREIRVPVILLTGHGNYELDVEAMRAGAADYLAKAEATPRLLERTIRYTLERQQSQAALLAAKEELETRVEERTRELAAAKERLETTNQQLHQTNQALQKEVQERQQAQEALQEREQRLNQFLKQLPAITWSTDKELRLTYVQGRGPEFVGPTGEHLLRKHLREILTAVEPQGSLILAAHRHALEGKSRTVEVVIEDRTYQARLEPLYGSGGQITGCIGMALDVTEFRQAEQALQESQARLKAIVNSAPLIVWATDLTENVILVEGMQPAEGGNGPGTFTHDSILELVSTREETHSHLQRALSGESFTVITRGGASPDYFETHYTPYYAANGSIQGVIAVSSVVTDRIKAEFQLSYQAQLLNQVNDAIISTDTDFCVTGWNQAAKRIYGWKAEEVLGEPIEQFLGKADTGSENERVIASLLQAGQFQGKIWQTCKDGKLVYVDIKASTLRDEAGQISGYVSVNRDITVRKQAEDQLQMYAHRSRALAELSKDLAAAGGDIAKILEIITCRVGEATESQCTLALISEDGKTLIPSNSYHPNSEALAFLRSVNAGAVFQLGEGYNGKVALTGEPVLVSNLEAPGARAQVKAEYQPYLDRFGVSCLMVAPLRLQNRVIGTLSITRSDPAPLYTPEDLEFVLDLAERSALAISQAQLFNAVQNELAERRRVEAELAELQRRLIDNTEAERRRLAQDLHDGPVQDLYGMSYQIGALAGGNPEDEKQKTFAALQAQMQAVIHDLRATAGELLPPTLAPFGLEKAIRSHVDQFMQAHAGLKVDLDLEPDGQTLPERVRLALFRIYQMAITNIARHAEASEVAIRLWLDVEQVILEIEDNGRGFQVPKRWIDFARQGHLGLAGASERAEAVGGTLVVDSEPGRGTMVRVVVPLEDQKTPE